MRFEQLILAASTLPQGATLEQHMNNLNANSSGDGGSVYEPMEVFLMPELIAVIEPDIEVTIEPDLIAELEPDLEAEIC